MSRGFNFGTRAGTGCDQASLRDARVLTDKPGDKSPGYFRPFLRNERETNAEHVWSLEEVIALLD